MGPFVRLWMLLALGFAATRSIIDLFAFGGVRITLESSVLALAITLAQTVVLSAIGRARQKRTS